jgi:hypothetical protein
MIGRSFTVSARVNQSTKDEIERIAKEARWSISQAVAVLIDEALEHREAAKKPTKKK